MSLFVRVFVVVAAVLLALVVLAFLLKLLVVAAVIAALVAAGNLLYGRHSHGAAAMNRVRAAQEAHDRAADAAAEARRAVAEAERRGERYCPLDPANLRPRADR